MSGTKVGARLYPITIMMTSAAGLKEFGDGDVALFNGNTLMDQQTFNDANEDFEAEFHRILTESIDTDTLTLNSSSLNNTTITAPNSIRNFTPQLSFLTEQPLESVKFEEDPLSAVLNFEHQSQSFSKSSDAPRKRGRPPQIKFKNAAIHKTILSKAPPQSEKEQHCHLQLRDRRSDSDFYSPVWIRGRGTDREGLCPLCEPATVWFKIKQSAYWYHMNFFHGVSAATGRPYNRPISYRYSPDEKSTLFTAYKVEGHCGNCLQWIPLATEYTGNQITEEVERLITFTPWFKHAQKCHYRTKEFQIPDM